MKFYFCYILECSDGSFYTGMTSDLEKRVQQHQEGMTYDGYTHSRRPVKLVWHVMCNDPNDAIRLEKQITGWTRRKKKALITENWDVLVEASKNYNEYGPPEDRQ
jgi:putative endonuclease